MTEPYNLSRMKLMTTWSLHLCFPPQLHSITNHLLSVLSFQVPSCSPPDPHHHSCFRFVFVHGHSSQSGFCLFNPGQVFSQAQFRFIVFRLTRDFLLFCFCLNKSSFTFKIHLHPGPIFAKLSTATPSRDIINEVIKTDIEEIFMVNIIFSANNKKVDLRKPVRKVMFLKQIAMQHYQIPSTLPTYLILYRRSSFTSQIVFSQNVR